MLLNGPGQYEDHHKSKRHRRLAVPTDLHKLILRPNSSGMGSGQDQQQATSNNDKR